MIDELAQHIQNNVDPSALGVSFSDGLVLNDLAAGCYNTNYLLEADGRRFVVRVNINRDTFEGGNAKKEFQILKKVDGRHAPRVFWLDTSFKYPFIIEEFIEGEGITTLTGDIIRMIATGLGTIHTYPGPEEDNVRSLKEHYIPLLDTRIEDIAHENEMHDALLPIATQARRYCEHHDAWFREHMRPGLLHGDMHCGNILKTDSGIVFIDWENCTVGDPAFDIVALFYESENLQFFPEEKSITEEQKELFFRLYEKMNKDPLLKEKVSLLYPLRWLSDTLWLACRICEYESLPEQSRDKPKAAYERLFWWNIQVVRRTWIR